MDFLSIANLSKTYEHGRVQALRGVTLGVAQGEMVALTGPSGCGKTTLLNLVGTLDRPTGGTIRLDGQEITSGHLNYLFRAQTVGFVFQFHHLIATMTVMENIETSMVALGVPKKERRRRAHELLERIGLIQRAHFFPSRISGGERQRAAVARAIVNRPRLLLADEPTGNLDTATGSALLDLLSEHRRQHGTTLIIATHNPDIAARCDRRILMRDGMITES
jgi:ABC-type lipoprotein export system ATPase subunit